MNFHLFTVSEATEAIPELTRRIREINSLREDLKLLLVELDSLQDQKGSGRDASLERRITTKKAEVTSLRRGLQQIITSVHDMGCVMRDYQKGLVDFPAIVEGQPGYLCWHLGEEAIAFWHGPEDGFAGRRPLGNAFKQGDV